MREELEALIDKRACIKLFNDIYSRHLPNGRFLALYAPAVAQELATYQAIWSSAAPCLRCWSAAGSQFLGAGIG